jgi:hypothetical protein
LTYEKQFKGDETKKKIQFKKLFEIKQIKIKRTISKFEGEKKLN